MNNSEQQQQLTDITKEELETFLKSKGWLEMHTFLQTMYLEAEAIVTAEGTGVSNSVKLENANKMAIAKRAIHYPSELLNSLQGA